MRTVGRIVPEEEPVGTDSPYSTAFRRSDSHLAVQATVTSNGTVAEDRMVYRRYQTEGAPLFVHNDSVVLRSIPGRTACGNRDVLYTNGEISLCVDGGDGSRGDVNAR
jgi:hypothetical protein